MATEAGPGLGGKGACVEPGGGATMVWRVRGQGFDGFAGPGAPVAGVGAGAFGEVGEAEEEFAAGVRAEAVEVVLLEFEGFGVVAEGELDQGPGHFGGHATGGGGEGGAPGDPDADLIGGEGDGAVHQLRASVQRGMPFWVSPFWKSWPDWKALPEPSQTRASG
jgi:hypothetical protein